MHLGTPQCRADDLIMLLNSLSFDRLFLIGDIVDIKKLKERWYFPETHLEVLRRILFLSEVIDVIYLPGNHELAENNKFLKGGGLRIGDGITVCRRFSYDGYLLVHGDQIPFGSTPLQRDWYKLLEFLYNKSKRKSAFIKWLRKRTVNITDYVDNFHLHALRYLKESPDHKGIICGHNHLPQALKKGDYTYLNCGDWVKNSSAIAQKIDGTFELISCKDSELKIHDF